MSNLKSRIIGLVGLPGSGKTTVAAYLETKNFTRITLSDFIKEDLVKHGITREILQDYGNKMREKYGAQILAELALKSIKKNGRTHVVIDGIRNLSEISYLASDAAFILVGIVAGTRLRYKRLLEKKGKKWVGGYNHFLQQERREEELGTQEHGLRVKECLAKAHKHIRNNSTFEELQQKINELL